MNKSLGLALAGLLALAPQAFAVPGTIDDGSNGDHADWAGAQIVLASARSQHPEAFIPPAEPAPLIAGLVDPRHDRPLRVLLEVEGARGVVCAGYPFMPREEREVFTVESGGSVREEVIAQGGNPFTNQFERFARAVRGKDGALPTMEWSVGQARVMEAILGKIGVQFGGG